MHILLQMFPNRFEAAMLGFAFGVATATFAFALAISSGLVKRTQQGGAR